MADMVGTAEVAQSGAEPSPIDAEARYDDLLEASKQIVSELHGEVQRFMSRRQPTEERWLRDLRQFHGNYEPTEEAVLANDAEKSKVFINITRVKVNAWVARLGDLLLSTSDKWFGVNATPKPELGEHAKEALKVAERAAAQAQEKTEEFNAAGADEKPGLLAEAENAVGAFNEAKSLEERARGEMTAAETAAAKMELTVYDQLVESQYPNHAHQMLEDGVRVGSGVMKGPISVVPKPRRWAQGQDGKYALVTPTDMIPRYKRVNYWHFFPDPDSTSMDDCPSTFERHLLSKSRFRKMQKEHGWGKRACRDILSKEPQPMGTESDLSFLNLLRIMGDDNADGISSNHKFYIVWEYHGTLEYEQICTLLAALDRTEHLEKFKEARDPLNEYKVIAYFCQGQMIGLSEFYPLDTQDSLYSVWSFEKAEAWVLGGVGVPWIIRNEQDMLNSAVRMSLDNGALSAGPQIVVDKTQIDPEDGDWKMVARKIWLKAGQDIGRDTRPFEVFSIPNNQGELLRLVDLALKLIDEVVAMPKLAEGEQGTQITQTASGMAMLFNSANVLFRRVVRTWDDFHVIPVIRRAVDWNMQFSKDESIKGDLECEAKGSSVLMVRELQSQILVALADKYALHPVFGPMLRGYELLRSVARSVNLNPDKVLLTQEEFEANLKKLAESAANERDADTIRAEASVQVAQIDAESRKLQGENQLSIANINNETALLSLLSREGVDIKRIEALLAVKSMEGQTRERLFASEAAIEMKNAEEARARGDDPSGSGGSLSFGSDKPETPQPVAS